jgi:hypothetical protein
LTAPPPSRVDLAAGLEHVFHDVAVREGYLAAAAGYDQGVGGWARGEVGFRAAPNLGVFGFGQEAQQGGFTAGLGAKLTFDL